MGRTLTLLCLNQKLFSDAYLRVTCWLIGTIECILVRNPTCDSNNARKRIWHVGTLARLARLAHNLADSLFTRGEWPSGLYSLRQVTEVKLGRVRSDFGWVTSED